VLLHLRVTVPPDRTDAVRALFDDCPGSAHVAVLPGASVQPTGDLVLADVAREAVDGLVADLRSLGIDRDGGLSISAVDAAVSGAAERAEKEAPGAGADAVVWEQVVRTTAEDSTLSVAFLAFLTIATMLAAIAIVVDSAILTVGAMVLGPEFAPLAAVAVGIIGARHHLTRRAAATLVTGFAVAILVTTAAALVWRSLGWIQTDLLDAERPQTGFITAPDRWSLVVAVLAGIAGVLSLTAAKSGALVGVFISVTTVPAAGDISLALALGDGQELALAATQLGINLMGILVAAIATLALQRRIWRRMPRFTPRLPLRGGQGTIGE
jgi:uncharacterized hydrophobic protein (TIGR00271 family)